MLPDRPAYPAPRRRIRKVGLFAPEMIQPALTRSLIMFRPDIQWKNPVMFVVEVGALLVLFFILSGFWQKHTGPVSLRYLVILDFWLFLTLFFANFATALAEARGRAQADSLRQTRQDTTAIYLQEDGSTEQISSSQLKAGDRVVVTAGHIIPGDGEIIEGIATIDEAAITGESAPVVREAGSDRSYVTGGTTVLSDRIVVRISGNQGDSFLDRMIALVEGAIRQKSPNEIALTMVLSAFTLIFLIVVVSIWPAARYAEQYMSTYTDIPHLTSLGTDISILISLLICLIPTTIGALLSAIGIAGMDRALQANVIANSGRAVEMAGDIEVVLLDKTGTITLGNRSAIRFLPLSTHTEAQLAMLAGLASVSDTTPEGKSILNLCASTGISIPSVDHRCRYLPFSAATRMSGIDFPDGREIRKGAPDAIRQYAKKSSAALHKELEGIVEKVATKGATPLVIAENGIPAGVVALEDILKPHMRERFAKLRQMGLRSIMITGDNAKTAAAIANEAGVDDFLAEATPARKLDYIRSQQAEGRLVAMMGDGTNDAPALAQADVALAMNAGTEAAREAANMIDLDNDPTKLIEVVEIGKQLLITRGALTTFSVANDIAKYFAVLPALFAGTLPWLATIDFMHLNSPTSAILATVIYNALIIPILIPVALKGVRYQALGANALLRNNLLIWGLGGILMPFPLIKLIDLMLTVVL